MLYAMVLKNRVISIVESEVKPNYPPDQSGNEVSAIPCESDVNIGMVYDKKTGSFFNLVEQRQESMDEKIYAAVSKSQDAIRQEGADMVMDELLKRGLIV